MSYTLEFTGEELEEKLKKSIEKKENTTKDNIVTFDKSGDIKDSTYNVNNFCQKNGVVNKIGNIPLFDSRDGGLFKDSGKSVNDFVNKVSNATQFNLASFDDNGQIVDSGYDPAKFIMKNPVSNTNNVVVYDVGGTIKDSGININDLGSGSECVTYEPATDTKDGLFTADGVIKLRGIEQGANKTIIVDNCDSTSTTSALSANQGNILRNRINAFRDSLITVEDNFNSDSPDNALSANKGKNLNDRLTNIESNTTDWEPCVLTSNFSNYSDDQILQIRKTGKVVEIRGAVKAKANIAGSSNMDAVITVVNESFRPSQRVTYSSVGTGVNMQLFTLYPNGNLTLLRYISMTNGSYTTVTSAMWISIHMVYTID